MLTQTIQLQERSIAIATLETFAGVSAYVRLKIIALSKTFRTLIAFKGLLAGMRAHVYGQIVSAMKTFAAERAQIRLVAGVIAVKRKILIVFQKKIIIS